MKKSVWFFITCLLSMQLGMAQQIIKGKVLVQEKTNPIGGVTVAIEGSKMATQTDNDGQFQISVPENQLNRVLVFTTIGFETKRINCADSNCNDLVVFLKPSVNSLDDVVITGQGASISKRRLSTNVVSIDEASIKQVPGGRIDQLLQSKLPNAQIRFTGGQAGASTLIRSRGISSAFINSTPIIYVDGVRLDNLNTSAALSMNVSGNRAQGTATSSIADIPVDNIEKIEFINGGAATTLFGSDAANGVLQIFTKKGGTEKLTVNFEAQAGWEKSTNDFLFFKRTPELLFETGLYQRYSIGVNGGQGKNGFSFAGSYHDNEGVMIYNQNRNRGVSLRSGFRAGLGKYLTYESSFSFASNNYNRSRNGNAGGYTGLWFTEAGASAITGPRFNNKIDDLSPAAFDSMKQYVREAERLQNNTIAVNRFQTSQTFILKPARGLVFRAIGGMDYRFQRDQQRVTNTYISHTTGNQVNNQGFVSNYNRNFFGITLEANGQYTAQVNDFSFITTAGGQLFRNDDRQVEFRGDNIRDGAQTISLAATRVSNEALLKVANYGIYVQENIGYKNKLFLDLGIRGDGNSAFGENIGIQYFPKVGISYIPSAESYFEGLQNTISSAKIRANFGEAGNFPTPFANERTIQFTGFLGQQAATFGQPGNSELRPERTATFEAGIDLGFWDDRFTLSTGYYRSITRDALFVVPPAPSLGETNQLRNVGRILNRGFELNTTVTAIRKRDVELRFNLALNTLYNEVLSSGGAAPFNINGFSARTIQTVIQEGQQVGFLRGNFGVLGADGTLASTAGEQFLGNTLPTLFGNMGFQFNYKKLSVFANADYQQGAVANSFDRMFRFNYRAAAEGIPQAEIDRSGTTNWLNFTNLFVEKTDFLKVRIIGTQYDLTGKVAPKTLKSFTVGFSVNNPFNFAASSFDPENTISGGSQGQNGASTGGISYATYSLPRQFIAIIRTTF